ncbi:hypothetical protein [Spirosoma montaniterrae]|uniref:Outer membrane protein beta-barrel domain-containing protein n=1 Tax=Spirosoma montaniterrae TaxID=1178516 RepID=A0A1P9X1Z6_9BACT|nr:hypothetical protein [Spirosoma montaniterrae]AQG81618.1 hypothetical protein AWR27_21285 [Spirosoma montaniterrae]
MKQLFTLLRPTLLLLLYLHQVGASAQTPARRPDQIVKLDNSVIEVIINEIDETGVSYRLFGNASGPVSRINKTDISYIRYTNGDVERFAQTPAATAVAKPAQTLTRPAEPVASSAPATPARKGLSASQPKPARNVPVAETNRSTNRPQGLRDADSGGSGRQTSTRGRASEQAVGDNPKASVFATVGAGAAQYMIIQNTERFTSQFAFVCRFGLGVRVPLSEKLTLEPTLEYAQLGGVWTETDDQGTTTTATLTLNNAQFSLPLVYTSTNTGGLRFLVGCGPYGILGTSAVIKANGEKEILEYGFDMRRAHVGAIGLLGVRKNKVGALAYGSSSLTNLYGTKFGDTKIRVLAFGLSLRYYF